jgi:hypothetical protein
MKNLSIASLTIALLLCLGSSANGQDAEKDAGMQSCPIHQQNAAENSHHATIEKHGDQAMGFSHDATTHHFRIAPDGGEIEVTANDPQDRADTEAIRSHLSHIAVMFGNGDFSTPMFVHDGIPPGVTTMKILKVAIQYKYKEIASGGQVRIESSDPGALAAIHDFLRFQITDHQTGDSLAVEGTH